MKTQSTKIKQILRPAAFLALMILMSQTLSWGTTYADPKLKSDQQITVEKNRLTIEWSAGQVAWRTTEQGLIPEIAGFETSNRPGAMQLPFQAVTFAIPADSTLATSVVAAKTIPLKTAGPVAIAARPAGVLRDENGTAIGGNFQEAELNTDLVFETVEIEEIGTMGGVRLGRAVFNPIHEAAGEFSFVRHASVEIVFNSNRVVPSLQTPIIDSPMAKILQQQVANPTHLIPNRPMMPLRQHVSAPTQAAAVINFTDEGMAQLTYQQLNDSGVDPAQFDTDRLQITQAGVSIPLLWMGDADGQFEPGEAIRFYAPRPFSRWSNRTSFLLSNGLSPRRAMQTRDGLTVEPEARLKQRLVFEENNVYTPDCLCGPLDFGWDGDRWMWAQLSRPGERSLKFDAVLDRPDLNSDAAVTLSLLGKTALDAPLDHHVQVRFNGSTVGEMRWDGQTGHTQTFTIPADLLQASNQIELTLVDSGQAIDSVWLDAVTFETNTAIHHPEQQEKFFGATQAGSYSLPVNAPATIALFDVTVPTNPQRLTNINRFDSSVSWGDEGRNGAVYAIVPAEDYLSPVSIQPSPGLRLGAESGVQQIIIAPQEFINSGNLDPLVTLRQQQGVQAAAESAEEIYVAFGDGEPRPEAIRDYLQWAYQSWATTPEMVLLVGDGSTDPKQNLASSPATRIPPFLITVDPWMGETAADNRFVTVDGDDNLPDLMLGRLPVNTTAELEQVVTKIVRYETADTPSFWNAQTMWGSDNAGSSRSFELFSKELIGYFITKPFYAHPFSLAPNGANETVVQRNVANRWQQGVGLVMYMGHASRHQWAGERLFHIDDVASLGNQERLPFVMHLSCLTGSFHSAHLTALDEQLVRQPDGGAIAVWGSSGLGVATGHSHLAVGALDSIYTQQEATLGMATAAGKIRLATRGPEHMLMLDTFNLLGDPATQLNLNVIDTSQHSAHLPFVHR